ncbi:MAG: iron chelate uptake ABC transporter family permease subunit [Chloroflexota bacterium]
MLSVSRFYQRSYNQKLIFISVAALILVGLYMSLGVTDWAFSIPFRGRKAIAILLVGYSIAYSTVIFHTITNNKILTPSIIGLDALYVLIQTTIVFIFGGLFLDQLNPLLRFAINVGAMIFFAGLLFRWLFGREGRHLYFLILVGVVFGIFFGTVTNFMQKILDPNEFSILQGFLFASINNVDEDLIWISLILIAAATIYSARFFRQLDVISLGREHAINLGIDHTMVVNRLMVVITILVSVSTALVGPITFFSLLVANLAYRFMQTYKHVYLIPAAVLISFVALFGGQLIVERVFTFSTTLNVIVNFVGGIYFLVLLLQEQTT